MNVIHECENMDQENVIFSFYQTIFLNWKTINKMKKHLDRKFEKKNQMISNE